MQCCGDNDVLDQWFRLNKMSLDAAKESLKSKSVAFIGTGDPPIAHAKQIDIIGNQNFDHFDLYQRR